MKGMGRYHALSFCLKASAGKERAHPHQTCGLFWGVLYAISEGGQSGPSFLLLAFIF